MRHDWFDFNHVTSADLDQSTHLAFLLFLMSAWRPVNFVLSSSKKPTQEYSTTEQKSTGDEVAELYRSITSNDKLKKDKPVEKNSSDMVKCESCNLHIPVESMGRHIRGTAHMVSADMLKAPDLLFLNEKNVGFKMLRSQGWEYEQGLGATGQGRRHPIATALKQDRLGIGHPESSRKRVTHTWQQVESQHQKKQRKEVLAKPSGKQIARAARKESKRRVQMLNYLKS